MKTISTIASSILLWVVFLGATAVAQAPPLVKPCVQVSGTSCPPVTATNPLPVAPPDDTAITVTPLSGTGTLMAVTNTAGYGSASIQITSAGTGGAVSYQISDDGTTWTSTNCYVPNATPATSTVTSSTTTTQLICATPAKQFRAQVTALVSGTVNGVGNLRKDPPPKQAIQATPYNVTPTKSSGTLVANTAANVLAASTTRKGGYCVNTGNAVIYYDDTGSAATTTGELPLLQAQTSSTVGGVYNMPTGLNAAVSFKSTGTPTYYCVSW